MTVGFGRYEGERTGTVRERAAGVLTTSFEVAEQHSGRSERAGTGPVLGESLERPPDRGPVVRGADTAGLSALRCTYRSAMPADRTAAMRTMWPGASDAGAADLRVR